MVSKRPCRIARPFARPFASCVPIAHGAARALSLSCLFVISALGKISFAAEQGGPVTPDRTGGIADVFAELAESVHVSSTSMAGAAIMLAGWVLLFACVIYLVVQCFRVNVVRGILSVFLSPLAYIFRPEMWHKRNVKIAFACMMFSIFLFYLGLIVAAYQSY